MNKWIGKKNLHSLGEKRKKKGKGGGRIDTRLLEVGKGNDVYISTMFSKLTYPMLQAYTCNRLCDAGQQNYLEAKEFTMYSINPI